MMDQDFMVLGKLIFALAVILYSSVNTLVFNFGLWIILETS